MQKIAKIRLKFSKIAAKRYKIHINDQKPTNHNQNDPKILKIKQYLNQTSKPKELKHTRQIAGK